MYFIFLKAEMGDSNKQICRVCLEITPASECEPIEETKKELLEVLLITIDFDRSDNAVACSRCLERLQNCFDFKSQVNTFVDVDVKVDLEKASQACQLCMSLIKDEAFNYATNSRDGVLLKDMVSKCLPEVDFSTDYEHLICNLCLSGIKNYYEFMKSCQEVEQRIDKYCQVAGHGTTNRVNLEDVLFNNCDILGEFISVKTEYSDGENVNVNIMTYPKTEDTENIDCSEVYVKDELDNGVETSEDDRSEYSDSSGKNDSSKSKRKVRKCDSKGKRHFCPKCPYSSERKYHIKQHMRYHTNNEVHSCSLCPFTTDTRLSLKAHIPSHKGSTKAFGCHTCPYETDLKYNLVRHLIKHKDTLEVEMHKCALCPFESKYKSAVVLHQKMHDQNIKTYKCEECSFSTKQEENFERHQLKHKKPEEIPKHKCDKCEFETKYKMNLVRHWMTHEDPELTSRFKCEKCPYRAKWQRDLRRHMLIHSDKHPYSCDECNYTCNYSGSLRNHKRIHQKNAERNNQAETPTVPSQEPKWKCAHCPYETPLKQLLSRHMRRRHSTKDQPTLKCALCIYVTTEKGDMRKHSFVHKEAQFQCNHCDFRTKHKGYLQDHMAMHDPSKQPKFKCEQCEYHTRKKGNLQLHQLRHKELGETVVYYCATCDYQTKYKQALKYHTKCCLKKKRMEANEKKKKSKK